MLKFLGWVVKTSLFVLLILVLGSVIHWRGRTVSDQIKTQVTRVEGMGITKKAKNLAAEYTPNQVPNYIKEAESTRLWTKPVKQVQSSRGSGTGHPGSAQPSLTTEGKATAEQIAPSERQKLRALIRELSNERVGQVTGNP